MMPNLADEFPLATDAVMVQPEWPSRSVNEMA